MSIYLFLAESTWYAEESMGCWRLTVQGDSIWPFQSPDLRRLEVKTVSCLWLKIKNKLLQFFASCCNVKTLKWATKNFFCCMNFEPKWALLSKFLGMSQVQNAAPVSALQAAARRLEKLQAIEQVCRFRRERQWTLTFLLSGYSTYGIVLYYRILVRCWI